MEKNRRGVSYITEPQRHWQSNKQNKKVELKSKCLRRRDLKMLDQQRAQGAGNYVRGASHQVQEAGSRHQTQEVGPPESEQLSSVSFCSWNAQHLVLRYAKFFSSQKMFSISTETKSVKIIKSTLRLIHLI